MSEISGAAEAMPTANPSRAFPAVTAESIEKHTWDWHGCTAGCPLPAERFAHHAEMHDDERYPPLGTSGVLAFGHTHEAPA